MRTAKMPPIVIKDGHAFYSSNTLKNVFPASRHRITYLDRHLLVQSIMRYDPADLLFCCRNPLPLDDDLRPQSPIKFTNSPEIGRMFGLDFGTYCIPNIMFGHKNECPIPGHTTFTPADTMETALAADHVLMRIHWNREHPNPCSKLQLLAGATHAETITSNSGFQGVDWWVFPITAAKDSASLQRLQQAYAQQFLTQAEAALRLQRLADSIL